MFTNESEASAESKAYDSASVVPIHTRLELSSDSDSAYDSASVASVNQPLTFASVLKRKVLLQAGIELICEFLKQCLIIIKTYF